MRSSIALLAAAALCMAARTSSAQYEIRPLDPGDGGVARWGRPAGGVAGPAPILKSQASAKEALNVARYAGMPPNDYEIYGASPHRFWLSFMPGDAPRGAAAGLTWDSRLMLAVVMTSNPVTTPLSNRQSWQLAVFRPEQIGMDSEGRPQFPCDLLNGDPPSPLGSVMFSAPVLLGDDVDPVVYNGGVTPVDPATGLSYHGVPAIVPDPAFTGAQNPEISPMTPSGMRAVYHLQIYAQGISATWITIPGIGSGWAPNDDGNLGFLRVRVTVDNYREPTATISNVTVMARWVPMLDTGGNPVGGGTAFPVKEPTATFDGKLVVCAPGGSLMYTYNSDPTSPSGWTPLRDLNHLYTDAQGSLPALSAYPLARARLRGPDGALIPQAAYNPTSAYSPEAFQGSYPWMTPDGDAVVFTTVVTPSDARRGGLVYLGSQTDHRIYHIDGSLNADRESSSRLVSAGLSLSPGFWDVLRDANVGIPTRLGKPNRSRLALVNVSSARYGEIDLSPFRDPDVVAFLPMNEEIRHHPGPTSAWHYDAHRWDHDPQSTIDLRQGRRGQLVGAKFPVEHHNPAYVSTPHVIDNSATLPPDIDYNAGFVGNAIFFWPGTKVEVPHDSGLGWTGSFTARCFFRPDSLPSSGSSQVDLISMSGKYRLGVTFDRRVFGDVVLPGVGRVSLQTNAGMVPGSVWYHLALTYDLQTGIARLWVDGVQRAASSPTPQAATASGSGQPLVIGPASSSGSSSAPWLRIDEVGIDKVAREGNFLWDASYRPPQAASGSAPTPALIAKVPPGLDPNAIFAPVGSAPWSDALAELGEDLFFDPKVSSTNTMSCASCHDPALSFASPNPFDIGVAGVPLRRHTPTLVNRAFSAHQFWDGHASSLEDQAIRPIIAPTELGFSNAQTFLNKIENIPGYAAEFQLVFGGTAPPFVTQPRVEAAFAAFQRSLFSGASSFDLGQMPTSGAFGNAVRGEQVFRGKARCSSCHSGFNFTDELFHNTGSDHGAIEGGRAEVTGYALDHGAFKTPTVRDTMRRSGSLFHDGSHDIDDVLEFYDQGGVHQHQSGTPDGVIDPDMVPLNLTAVDKADLKEFLKALDGAPIVVANPPDAFEPNDVFYVAPLLAMGDHGGLDLTVRDVDLFTVNGPATVTITFTNAHGNLDLFAATPALQLVAQSVSTTANLESVAIPSGTHIVCVASLVSATNSYDLTVGP